MQRFFIELAYNGKNYNGWQIQENASTVQEVVNKSLSTLFRAPINVVGCGRTDSGVHARQFFAHFELDEKTLILEGDKALLKLNSILPGDIVIKQIIKVKDEAHARFDAISRTYKYYLSTCKNVFSTEFAYYYPFGNLDIKVMNEAASKLIDFTDFTSFSKLHTQVKTNNCKIHQALWAYENDLIVFTITADRFLRNMVRAIVGTLIDVGRAKLSIEEFIRIVESKNRSNAGYSVPALGLFLERIEYPESIFLNK
ncbi:MAG: tRNA pseudouridine(38-40) synthase TruA [Bacteroidales bacterium]|nr:tRNA pseudouridine(38-40) synthase TruA [Bacteroidales bacterium]MCF8403444.1 tRNA pseudouridine(38-40) synthase TruA [Bacteroidales bacterium]